MKDLNIYVIYSDPDELNKNAIVERSNRTIRSLLERYRLYHNDHLWYKYLPIIVETFNNMENETTKHKPIDIWEEREFNEQDIIRFNADFKVGDIVRKAIKKKIFDKIDTLKHSKELYQILEVKKNRYLINDGTRRFHKPYELTKANTVIFNDQKLGEKTNQPPTPPIPTTKRLYRIPIFEPIKTRSKKLSK